MATTKEYADFALEQLAGLGSLRCRKMFGEYLIYIDEKPVMTVCDNTVFVKKLPALADLMADAPCGYPYDGAKEHYILDVEDRARTDQAVRLLLAATPLPKKRK